ncbi:MAG: aminodeoxychorismate lyase [Spongiibacteraceae bacterium]|nr:aminodeoxychorismate lyase [Spongiibacteraceae bacterium]|tara:strand:- start:330 stop:1394 length:1065 start_codon:yes stop_codon:yes gene_type:complete
MPDWAKRLFSLTLVFITLLSIAVIWADIQLSKPLAISDANKAVELAPGTGFASMSARLQREQLIDYSPQLLNIYARLAGKAGSIKAGEYALRTGMNSYELLDLMISGDVVRYQVTLVEGRTFAELQAYLADHPQLQQRYQASEPLWPQLGIGSPLNEHPEGLFFPDTYSFVKGASDLSILKRAYRRMQLVLEQEWARRVDGLPYQTPYEALIMASIVERETGQPDERERIAGVFVSRLQKNMRLQTDPTVIYGLDDAEKRNLRTRHLLDDTNPYNTYRHKGLPPTPIAMPGLAAIRASLNPLQDGAIYFVARGDGSHQFSETLEQHQQAVRDFQLKRRKDYRSSPLPAQPAQEK